MIFQRNTIGHPISLDQYLRQGAPNNLDFVRIFAAFLVLFGHSFTLLWSNPQNVFPHDPVSAKILQKLPFQEGLPGIGVHIFFFISGLLVTRSFFNHQNRVFSFIKARLLRILPAYVVCILVIALLAGPFLTNIGFNEYFKSAELREFLKFNLTFTGLSTLPGVFVGNPFGRAVNGSLWTIPYELQLYGWVLLLGLLTVLKRKGIFSILFAYVLLAYCGSGYSNMFLNMEVARLWILFFLGVAAAVYADKIILSPLALLALFVTLALTWKAGNPWFDVIGSALFGYAILVFAFVRYIRFIDVGRVGDYSYGVYLYAFPVQQSLIYFFKHTINAWELVLYTAVITLVLAAASWHAIEKPALRLKSSPRAAS